MSVNLFFNSHFGMEFTWRGQLLRVGSVLPENKKQISEGLRYMSPESIRNRFLASKKEFTEKELEYLTTLDGWNHYAIGIEEREKLKRGVGVIRLVRSSAFEDEAETAITIIDEFQRMGLGSFLISLMILAARERNIHRLSFTYLPQNEAILKLISKAGRVIPGSCSKDYEQSFLDLTGIDIDLVKSQLAMTLPEIESFHLRT